jgi:hypothetical protein
MLDCTSTSPAAMCILTRFCSQGHSQLFVPCSVFTVLELHVPANPSDDDPVVVRLMAAVDNV